MFQMHLMMLFLFLLGVSCETQLFHCDQQDQSSLLRLKHHLVFDSTMSHKLETWNSSSDCCVWDGVTCRADDGHVVSIELKAQCIFGGVDDSDSPLFDLHHLQLLDLSYNNFNGTQIPSGIDKLLNLLHLDLSYSNFGGQVPAEISSLTSLLTLHLSDYSDRPRVGLKLENPKLSGLIRNLTRLTEFRLDGVNMSAEGEGHAWGQALSSSLPHLQVLSVRNCSLSGPLHISLIKLQALTYMSLGWNNLSSEIPNFLAKFSNLTSLRLAYCGLYGKLPRTIFNIVNLRVLELSFNDMLSGTLPETIGNATALTVLHLMGCGLSGSITNIRWENLENLVRLYLSRNALNGTIPLSLFSLPSLTELYLSQNQFRCELGEFPTVSPSPLRYLILGVNRLEGSIPTSIFNLHNLEWLHLSFNNFSGTFDLSDLFQNFGNLSRISLSFSSLSVIETVDSIIYSSFPHQLERIGLASCSLKAFPSFLKNHSMLVEVDLSDNNIVGDIPSWIWKPSMSYLNLSHNSLTGFEGPNFTFPSPLRFLDLSSNLLQGQIPLAPLGVVYGPHLEFLSLSNNNFQGGIPPSLCCISRDNQPVIDLSNNSFSGTIPPCLTTMSFGVLNLKRNNLSGNIPDVFHDRCSLQTLDLSYNHLRGTVPKSVMNCKALEVINLGNNGLKDEFPFWLMNISSLRVLVLRSNKSYGPMRYETSKQTSGWTKLQIIDIAANNFCGKLPLEVFKFWTGMKGQTGTVQPQSDKLGFGPYYQDTVIVSHKGFTVELVKFLTIFTAIDFSYNYFEGSIPSSIGDLKSLYALNLSHNRFTGYIPSSFGNLKMMESLDHANNRISGVIPNQLASLTFLSYLNLSYNQLVGGIPTSTQLQSFSEWSYVGNKGLYGPPLEVNCVSACGPPPDPTSEHVSKGINWQLIWVEIGYIIGFGSVIGSLVFWRRWRFWFFEHVDRLLWKVFPRLDPNKRNHRKRS